MTDTPINRPSTDTGRALTDQDWMTKRVLDIEAEAVAQERERLRQKVRAAEPRMRTRDDILALLADPSDT